MHCSKLISTIYSSILYGFFPLAEHGLILCLIEIDFSLILQLSKLSSSFFVHFFLKESSLDPVLLVHLLQQIQLMSLSSSCLLGFSGLILSILLGNSSFNLIFVVVLLPIGFPLHLLFEQYVFFSSLVDIFEQINSSLVLSCPLCISHFELSLSFLFDNFVNHRFIFSFVIFALSVVDLEVNNFLSSLCFFLFF